jgi:hypothetical protein
MEKFIEFEQSAKKDILDFLGMTIEEKTGHIIEKDTKEPILSPDNGEPIEAKDFAGLRKGSLVFIKPDINSIIELSDSLTT